MSVQEIMDDAQAFVADLQQELGNTVRADRADLGGYFDNAKEELRNALHDIGPFTIPTPPIADTGDQPDLPTPSTPTYPDWIGAGPVYQEIAAFRASDVAGEAPVFDAAVPEITLPSTPSQLIEFIGTAPTITLPTFPTPPDALLNPNFTAPDITEFETLTAPDVRVPTAPGAFTAVVPTAPSDLVATYQDNYNSQRASVVTEVGGYLDALMDKYYPEHGAQVTRIETFLAGRIDAINEGVDIGTGFSEGVEDAIYNRARGRNDKDAARARDTAYSEAASRGFTLPTGALLGAVARARQAAAENNAKAAADIAVAQAELEQKNAQFVVTTSLALRNAAINNMLSYMQNLATINGQALEFAKGALNALIEAYNTAVKAYSLRIEVFKAEVMSFEAQFKVVLAEIEVFQARIKSQESLINIDRAKIERYKAQMDGLNVLAGVFKSLIDATLGQAQLEKLKLEVFQAQVQVHGTQVQGKNAEWQGYTAAIEGESAKFKIFATQAAAFNSEMDGYRARLEGGVEAVKAQALTNKARAEQYGAEANAFEVNIKAESARLNSELENQRQYWQAVNGVNQVAESVNRINVAGYQVEAEARLNAYKTEIATEMKKVDLSTQLIALLAGITQSVISSHSSTTSAALSGINTLAAQNE